MPFTLRKLKHRPWPVTVKLLTATADGEVSEAQHRFVLNFKSFSEAEFKAMVDAAGPVDSLADMPLAAVLERNAGLFCQLVDGWGGDVCDEAGAPLAFSPELLRAMVTGPDGLAISAGINQALGEIRFGLAPQKNLSPSAELGRAPAPVEAATSLPATLPTSA